MSPVSISWKNLKCNKLTFLLNCLLVAFGTGILTILLLASAQIKDKLQNNAKDIDLVVGAKGSPLQLILSSIYYIDFPTGNVPLEKAEELSRNPMVKKAVPLALGDNYNGFRITGTDAGFIGLYGLKLQAGKFWEKDFEVTLGSNVAAAEKLKPGDHFFGAHGLTSNQDEHKDHPYIVIGVLSPQGNVTDNLVLTNIASIWKMHGQNEEAEEAHKEGQDEPKPAREITCLLIQYRSPMSIIMFPQMVNKSTNMQAASPALESGRLFSLIGVGVDTLQWFAILIMFIASVSVFVSLYNSLKERKYDLAVMRIMGASQNKLFLVIILEGIILTLIGSVFGIFLGHFALHFIGSSQASTQAKMTGMFFIPQEGYLFAAGIAIGLVAAIIPAIEAYRSDIAKIISKH
ncbi:MAG: transporter permease [Segetibacter sp.]|nr:transporter permease [Segetibacter sp.]